VTFDVVIVGAGAAGLMCAISAGRRGRRVLLLEHEDKAGKKILISGGGRCNFTNLHAAPENFLSANPHFCKSALARYTQHDFIALVEKHGIVYHEKTLGQLFCDSSARAIVAMLLDECADAGVDVRLGHKIGNVTKADRFRVSTDQGDFDAASVVLAIVGPSIPKMGATGFAHVIAKRFGLPLTEIRPGLVPLTFSPMDVRWMEQLSGVALDVVVRCGKTRFREAMLFTHRGLSGPAILQISSYWREGEKIVVNLAPDTDAAGYLRNRKRSRPKAEPRTILGELVPQRLAQWLAEAYLPGSPIGGLRDTDLDRMGALLNGWEMTATGSEGYAKAEVTLGGVDTNALSSRTMEAKNVPGLYFIGEAVDVTGWLGGYNFQWAWSSGWVAGEVA